jgi:Brp/Blh family beta-carotene 15,15'-monooxygenase
MLLAAFHFGETDLEATDTNSAKGKLFIVAYGFLILSSIIITHFDEVRPLLTQFSAGKNYEWVITWIDQYKIYLLTFFTLLFLVSIFINHYHDFFTNRALHENLAQLILILLILASLPLMLGFTFYFVLWHSVWSMRNIFLYVSQKNEGFSFHKIIGQMIFYSAISIGATVIFGLQGFMFQDTTSILGYTFLALAVLTAPHLHVMHAMYSNIKRRSILSA